MLPSLHRLLRHRFGVRVAEKQHASAVSGSAQPPHHADAFGHLDHLFRGELEVETQSGGQQAQRLDLEAELLEPRCHQCLHGRFSTGLRADQALQELDVRRTVLIDGSKQLLFPLAVLRGNGSHLQ